MLKRLSLAILVGCGLLLIVALESGLQAEICDKDAYTGAKDCALYNVVLVALWHIAKALNDYGAAITAIATVAVGYFTYTLYRTSSEQAHLTRDSIQLARDEFAATHRPRVKVQQAHLSFKGDKTRPAVVNYTLVNAGEAPAQILALLALAYVQWPEMAFVPVFDFNYVNKPSDKFIPPGEFLSVSGKCASIETAYDEGFVRRNGRLFVLGRITYLSSDGAKRNSGFCREYRKNSGRWHLVENSEYEYDY